MSDFQVVVPNRAPQAAQPIEARIARDRGHRPRSTRRPTSPIRTAKRWSTMRCRRRRASSRRVRRAAKWRSRRFSGARRASRSRLPIRAGLSASQSFRVTVPNRPPLAGDTIPSLTLHAGERDTVDVTAFFADPDGDSLAFAAAPADLAVAAAAVVGSLLVVTGVGRGETGVTVTALDPDGTVGVADAAGHGAEQRAGGDGCDPAPGSGAGADAHPGRAAVLHRCGRRPARLHGVDDGSGGCGGQKWRTMPC